VRRRHDDRRGIAEALNNLGVLAQSEDHLEEAQKCYEEALHFEQQLENTIGVARVLYNLSEIAETGAEWPRALRCAMASALLFEEIGSPLRRYAQDLYQRVSQQMPNDENAPELHAPIKSKTLNEVILWALD
jgi:tetratricopeptide (TPR) repeat protein